MALQLNTTEQPKKVSIFRKRGVSGASADELLAAEAGKDKVLEKPLDAPVMQSLRHMSITTIANHGKPLDATEQKWRASIILSDLQAGRRCNYRLIQTEDHRRIAMYKVHSSLKFNRLIILACIVHTVLAFFDVDSTQPWA